MVQAFKLVSLVPAPAVVCADMNTKSSKFAFGNETYGVILNQTGFKTYAPGLHQFFNFFPDASSRLDLSVTMLNMASRLAETGMVLP